MIVSKKHISRLSKYRKALFRFSELGFVKVFSDTLGEAVGVTASQVRKDFSLFGIHGHKRGGYQIDTLIDKLQNILGKDFEQKVIIVGIGNIGNALIKYKAFENEGIKIVAGFDIDPAKVNRKGTVPIFPLKEIHDYVKKHNITIGIIAVPDIVAQEVFDVMLSAGIKGILNFAPIRYKGAENVFINNVNFQVELENVIYFVNMFKHEKD
ncbi:redox-sensing transcriptional repressor Rex [bacterium]|nr:redox-sensing transcriptional repressor Rex [bacterium]